MIFDLKRATVKFLDGASSPNEMTIKVGEGNVTFEEKVTREYLKNRGLLDTVRNGDEEPLDVSIDMRWEFILGDSAITPVDFVKRRGTAASYTSSDPNTCAPFAIDIEIEFTPNCSTEKIETILLPDFRYETISFDSKDGTLSMKGKCNATAVTSVRTSQT